jgi:UDP-glucose 4-epimerase
MEQNVVIIGGAGFIGTNLAINLAAKNYTGIICDKETSSITNIDRIKTNFSIYKIDSFETQRLTEICSTSKNIIWLAHSSVPSTSMANIMKDINSNITPLINFLSIINKSKHLKNFIYISSGGSVYGQPLIDTHNYCITEAHPTYPISNYGLVKLIAERYIYLLLTKITINKFILRPSNVYGPYQNIEIPQGIIGHAFNSCITQNPIPIFDYGKPIRDYLFVDDLSSAIVSCLNRKPLNNFCTYNISSNRGYSIKEIIAEIESVVGAPVKINFLPKRDFDCTYNVLDNSLAKKNLKWEPKVNLTDGLIKVWHWLKTSKDHLR